ncbi:MAG: DUF3842 family protein [Deltaproteobacteria bacterium]|nr:DUF3842 family protein [Deltaproteobacteria bacterium]
MHICVIDGQGGGIGSFIIKRLREAFEETVTITALGTNAIATAQMLKAGANRGASGENAIARTVKLADVLVGPVAIVLAHAMMGEVTPRMAEAIAACPAKKFLIPLSQENVDIVGLTPTPLPPLIDTLIEKHLEGLLNRVRS